MLARSALLVRQQADTETVLKLLDSLSFSSAGNPPPAADLRRLRALAQAANRPSFGRRVTRARAID